MVDIFDEVSDDLRHDQAVSLARRYGGYLLGAAVAVLVGVGAQQGWQYYQAQQAQKAATQFLALVQPVDGDGANPDNATALNTAKALTSFAVTAPEGYKTLADLRAAGLYAAEGQSDQASALWTAISGDTAADPALRDLATLLWGQHELGVAPDTDVIARLQPLTASTNAYHGLALEAEALAYLHAAQTEKAKDLLSKITADMAVPDDVRSRAQILLIKLNG